MSTGAQIERRDPASGILTLGAILAAARKERRSGEVEVRDGGCASAIGIADGMIARLDSNGRDIPIEQGDHRAVGQHLRRLFELPRPHVHWAPNSAGRIHALGIDPSHAVLRGITCRTDLFHPLMLIERIPVDTLHLDPSTLRLPLLPEEQAFLLRLNRPTPVSLILWKRGLKPEHASALLVALNLLGAFAATWAPGDLPRNKTAAALRRKIAARLSDHEVLGVAEQAGEADIDRAFRLLSLAVHPDRFAGCAEREIADARAAFASASAAYSRIKRSRRRRPVRSANPIASEEGWMSFLTTADEAQRSGDVSRARAFALKALALSPPREIKDQLLRILRRAA